MYGSKPNHAATRWEHFHGAAAKRVYAMTSKRKATHEKEMSTAIGDIDKIDYMCEAMNVPSFKPTRYDAPDLDAALGGEAFKVTDSTFTMSWGDVKSQSKDGKGLLYSFWLLVFLS